MSDDGLWFLKKREGLVLTMYRDSADLPTIGYGHLLTKSELTSGRLAIGVEWHQGISQAVADELLRRDMAVAESAVGAVQVPLSPQQFDSLVSFAFNIGPTAFRQSTLLRLLNAGDYAAVPAQLRRWVHSAGRVDPILVKRREEEVRQWEAG